MTEAQAGGRKQEATRDHLMRLKNTINHIKKNKRKHAYVAFLDVTKAYDKAWIDAILYVMQKEGVDLKTWKTIKSLNENLSATIFTEYGSTRRISIRDSIRQGGVLSVIQYALLMDEINKIIILIIIVLVVQSVFSYFRIVLFVNVTEKTHNICIIRIYVYCLS